MTKTILTAYRRKWEFVSPEYILQYEDDNIQPLEDNKSVYSLNLSHIDSLPEGSLAKVSISNSTHHLLDVRPISAHRIIKNALREKPIKPKTPSAPVKKKGPVSGYPAYIQQNYAKIKAETGIKEFSSLMRIVLERWKKLSAEEKKQYSGQ